MLFFNMYYMRFHCTIQGVRRFCVVHLGDNAHCTSLFYFVECPPLNHSPRGLGLGILQFPQQHESPEVLHGQGEGQHVWGPSQECHLQGQGESQGEDFGIQMLLIKISHVYHDPTKGFWKKKYFRAPCSKKKGNRLFSSFLLLLLPFSSSLPLYGAIKQSFFSVKHPQFFLSRQLISISTVSLAFFL